MMMMTNCSSHYNRRITSSQQLSGQQQQPLHTFGRMPFAFRNMNSSNTVSNR